MELNRLFILNMKRWRKSRGLSQKTLSERCEAAHTYIRQIESGSRTPSFAFIGKLAQALEIEAYQLFYDETMGQNKKPAQMEHLEAIKTNILAQVAYGIDTVIVEAFFKTADGRGSDGRLLRGNTMVTVTHAFTRKGI